MLIIGNKSYTSNDKRFLRGPPTSPTWILHIPLLSRTHFHVNIGKLAKSINGRAPFRHLPTVVPVVGQVVNNESHLWELCNALVFVPLLGPKHVNPVR